jgi:protein-S-isoprenylcysteine O-methyltransferase Ste14
MMWDTLELKIMPMALLLICAALMYALHRIVPQLDLILPLNGYLGALLMLAGIAIVLAGAYAFRQAKTTVNPLTPAAASNLVMSGIYRYSRNPMYLGFLLILAGWSQWVANLAAFIVLPAFVLYLNRFQITPEERAMHTRFGEQYANYCQRVKRWL